MTTRELLSLAATHIDDAVEYLTFDRFDWAFEEAWRGVARSLQALGVSDHTAASPGANGALPDGGTLRALVADRTVASDIGRVVGRMEALRAELDGVPSVADALAGRSDEVTRIVFAANRVLEALAGRLGVPVPGVPDADAPPVGTEPDGVPRRRALQWLATGAVLPVAACARPPRESAPAVARPEAAPPLPSGPAAPAQPADIRAVTVIDSMHWPTSDPFLFCAHHRDDYPHGNAAFGPDASLEGRLIGRDFEGRDNWRMYHGETVPGFPRHPHRGFETVTVVRTGLLDHADSMGAAARYGGGDVQWLTAGGGIQHAEMFPLLRAEADNPLELFQIWLNLPARDKMVSPYFTMLWNERIPRVVVPDADGRVVEVTVAAGRFAGHAPPAPPPSSWASQPSADVAIWSLRLEPGARFELPPVGDATERSLYLHRGEGARIGGRDVPNASRVELDGAGAIGIEAGPAEVEILLLQGRPIGEPVARRGPFVMNTQDEIRQAYADYQRTQFGGWPWPGNDPVHGAAPVRFARHVDGRYEEPS